jgi:ATP-dependent Clp protease adaptor protein ClpS
MSIATPEVDIEEKIKETVLEPKRYNVIFLNDDVTPMDFVVEMLVGIFKHSEKTAQEITMTIHSKGSAVVGTYSYEIAEQKAVETTKNSREHGFPLQVAIEVE